VSTTRHPFWPPTRLALVVVSEDWFARSLLRAAAEESGRFGPIVDADDGYTALAETWEGVAIGRVPDVVLVDGASAGPSLRRLIAELRASRETHRIFVAVIGSADEGRQPPLPGVNFQSASSPLDPDLSEIIVNVAQQAALESEAA
jgi:CheY-like chemotaxis protein